MLGPTLPSAADFHELAQLSHSNILGDGSPVPFPSEPAPLFGPDEVQGSLSRLLQPVRREGSALVSLGVALPATAGGQGRGESLPPVPMPSHTR